MSSKSPPLHLTITAKSGKAHAAYLRRHLLAAHAIVRAPLEELSIAIVNDHAMASLHDRFLQINSPTDVLTFELDHDDRGKITAGEVIICLDEAGRQAKTLGTSIREELLLYAIHGMLHLCGFDDRTARGYRAMHAKEDQILTELNIGPVFARDGRRTSPMANSPARKTRGEIPGVQSFNSQRARRSNRAPKIVRTRMSAKLSNRDGVV